ncbi:MAG: YihY/virulence factor BrkB family protein [Bacteroidetes bacterium]|nr:YihY/virulence factor BrkB family protein [Bacteroidota bacterium]
MSVLIKLINKIYSRILTVVIRVADSIYPPGFEGASLYEIAELFLGYIGKQRFNLYAGALSFNFFLALFPSIIFLFTLVAYFPVDDLQGKILGMMEDFLPHATYETIQDTVADILSIQRTGLLSIGFVTAIYFASNGFHNLMKAFESSMEDDILKKRNFFKKRARSIIMTFVISLFLIIAIFVKLGSVYVSSLIAQWGVNEFSLNIGLGIIEILILAGLVFFIISFIYYYGHSSIEKWSFFSPGSIVATILSLVMTYLFSYYVNHFNAYNKVYGSIGAIMALMLVIYVNMYSILIGFELNHSITKVSIKKMREEKKKNKFMI